MLNSSFNRAKKIETSAFPGSLTYALVREVCFFFFFFLKIKKNANVYTAKNSK